MIFGFISIILILLVVSAIFAIAYSFGPIGLIGFVMIIPLSILADLFYDTVKLRVEQKREGCPEALDDIFNENELTTARESDIL